MIIERNIYRRNEEESNRQAAKISKHRPIFRQKMAAAPLPNLPAAHQSSRIRRTSSGVAARRNIFWLSTSASSILAWRHQKNHNGREMIMAMKNGVISAKICNRHISRKSMARHQRGAGPVSRRNQSVMKAIASWRKCEISINGRNQPHISGIEAESAASARRHLRLARGISGRQTSASMADTAASPISGEINTWPRMVNNRESSWP